MGESILVIEDDSDIRELVQFNLARQGFAVMEAKDGEDGLGKAKQLKPDLIVLDLMLPGLDGIDVCKTLRGGPETKGIPIVILSAKGEESDIVVGLELGADDYVCKPFSPRELIARIRAVLRRTKVESTETESEERYTVGPIEIDAARHEVFHRNEPMQLTLAEYRLLSTLVSRPGRVFTRGQLLEKIAGTDTFVIDRNVDVHVRAIRKKLGEDSDFIVTVRGVGYKCRE